MDSAGERLTVQDVVLQPDPGEGSLISLVFDVSWHPGPWTLEWPGPRSLSDRHVAPWQSACPFAPCQLVRERRDHVLRCGTSPRRACSARAPAVCLRPYWTRAPSAFVRAVHGLLGGHDSGPELP